MAEVLLFCPEPSGLKLGPSATPGEYIEFKNGWARFDSKDFPDWEAWVKHPTTPYIEILPADTTEVPVGQGLACQICGRAFAHKGALLGHLRTHAPQE